MVVVEPDFIAHRQKFSFKLSVDNPVSIIHIIASCRLSSYYSVLDNWQLDLSKDEEQTW